MTYVMLCAEHGDVIGTYATREDAICKLATFIEQHPEVQDDVGLRPYEDGRPSGEYQAATEVLGEQVTYQHLGWGHDADPSLAHSA
jgi:hypothetical protein